ncbi:protein of unknown function [Aminobacter niigataensis]|nr:protein of unknown function [Aminobacter niigataensis]
MRCVCVSVRRFPWPHPKFPKLGRQFAGLAGFALDSYLPLRHFSSIKMILKKHHFEHSPCGRNCTVAGGPIHRR